jgi:mRNA-degrading endonuclease RelE of RelBE toxin-antitoxin system
MSPAYTVELTRFAEEDFAALDHSLRILALKQLRKLESHPSGGRPLGHKFGYDLSRYRSLHFASNCYRIVYRLDDDTKQVTVVAIGKKAKFEVYRRAAERQE